MYDWAWSAFSTTVTTALRIGPAAFGVVNQITGSQRQAILSLIVFFVVGVGLLIPVDVRRAMSDVGQDPSRIRHG